MLRLVDKSNGMDRIIGVNVADISCVVPNSSGLVTTIYLISNPDKPISVFLPPEKVLDLICQEELSARYYSFAARNVTSTQEPPSYTEDYE